MQMRKQFIGDALCLDIWSSKLTFTDRAIKRILDLLIAFFVLFISLPILIIRLILAYYIKSIKELI